MATCSRCGATWRTPPGEEQDHDCPRCGPVLVEPDECDREIDEDEGWE
jgi:ribosomal protein S27AE